MVQTTFTGDSSMKREEIILAAQKRFGVYGMKKTAMMEIAEDLSLSKGLIYYYFPDKEHLYKAVVEKEIKEFEARVTEQIFPIEDPVTKLKEYVGLRLVYFRSLLNLSRLRLDEMQGINSFMCDTWQAVRDFEKNIILETLIKGNEMGLFSIDNPAEVTDLLFDILRGIRMSRLKDKQLFYLDQENYNFLVKQSEMLIDIFLQGLMRHKIK